jgi:hypothetical protein
VALRIGIVAATGVPLPALSVGLEGLMEDEAAFLDEAVDEAGEAADETPLRDCLSEVEGRIGQAWDQARSHALGEAPEEPGDGPLRAQQRQSEGQRQPPEWGAARPLDGQAGSSAELCVRVQVGREYRLLHTMLWKLDGADPASGRLNQTGLELVRGGEGEDATWDWVCPACRPRFEQEGLRAYTVKAPEQS